MIILSTVTFILIILSVIGLLISVNYYAEYRATEKIAGNYLYLSDIVDEALWKTRLSIITTIAILFLTAMSYIYG